MTVAYDEQARRLLQEVAVQSQKGFGTLSPAVYDTAWVAMVKKQVNGINTVLFPECLNFLKNTQTSEGSWISSSSDIDVIINTMAALLALKRQFSQDLPQEDDNVERCHRAENALHTLLAGWDIEESDQVGFEILIPNLLKLLELEGIYFDFPCRAKLMSLGNAKLAKLRPVLTGPNATTLLMNSSVWDDEAETYLRSVSTARLSGNYPHGGFPSAFPTTIFETVWVTSVLLDYGFTTQDFIPEHLDKVEELLKMALDDQGGTVGFAPGFLADADDTAKSILVLRKLGHNASIKPMLEKFEAHTCFLTYHAERNPSISANCNVLICLLQTPQPSAYTAEIAKCATYIIDTCKAGNVQDKWNISEQYSRMLIAQAFILLIDKKECDHVFKLAISKFLPDRYIILILFDILIQTMQQQQKNGSWESKHEVTAYSILTLSSLLCLPVPAGARQNIVSALEGGKLYLFRNRCYWQQGEYLWIEKVADAYMENVIELKHKSNLGDIKRIIIELCERYGYPSHNISTRGGEVEDIGIPQSPLDYDADPKVHITNTNMSIVNSTVSDDDGRNGAIDQASTSELQETSEVLEAFVAHILHHPQVLNAHHSLRSWLKYELETFLLAHVTHIEDCFDFPSSMSSLVTLRAPRSTYYNWVRGTGADHTSCPYSFVFYLCLAVRPGENPTGSAHQRFLLEDACHSLATICRQYNAFGSIARDRQEGNFNSINFPEFNAGMKGDGEHDSEETESYRKQDLLAIAK
ncbi:hypothetical protein BCON_0023g00330 [Botryotinia convoluta]|uniref:Uncharacterized protein n=1 Tax=Botryotinia convoluta TaxID=54673 RepID=A0A4Z1IN26_9HELO|nr:hypothetical protein BCON_0023g00330 [Botryotinia convoluta]